MATYALETDLVSYAAGTAYADRLPAGAPDRERLLELAEADLDGEVFAATVAPSVEGAPRILAPADLDLDPRAALVRAVCAQALYRVEMGDEHFVRAQRERVTGRSFSAEGKLPIIGPQVWRELARGRNLLRMTTSVGGHAEGRLWQ